MPNELIDELLGELCTKIEGAKYHISIAQYHKLKVVLAELSLVENIIEELKDL